MILEMQRPVTRHHRDEARNHATPQQGGPISGPRQPPLLNAALALLDAGFSVIPTGKDKRPLIAWKVYQARRMNHEEAQRHFTNGVRLAVVSGKVSGNLECLDFDDPTTYQPFLELLEVRCPGLPDKLIKRQTPSGGFHLLYRSVDPVAGNQKLAGDEAGAVRIETRGEGGYFLSAPSPGYKVISGSLTDCHMLNAKEVLAIHDTAKTFDQAKATAPLFDQARITTGDAPGDLFNQKHTATEILAAHGWKPDRPTSAGMGWTRPGKDSGTSGVLLENGNFYVWSSNAAPLEPGKSYSPFALFAAYNHGGDFSAAARELVKTTGNAGTTGDSLEQQRIKPSPAVKNEPGSPGTDNGFMVRSSGVYHKPDDPEATPVWICAPLHVRAMTRNEHGEAWGRLLEFNDPDGRRHEWACPLELLAGDGLDFRKVLMSQGLRVAPGSKARQLLAHYVQTAQTAARCLCTDKPGWHGAVYVMPGQTIGEQPGERVLLQTTGEPPRLRTAGTLAGWRENVARYCSGNSRLVVAVSAAFAAPLLNITGDESGGLNMVGSSSTGKTTALRVGASVWGGPEYVHRWRATDNGLEAVASVHNDGLLILDELAQIDPRRAGEVAYMLANGTGKHRAQRDGLARKALTWRLLFLSAGEVGLADHMRVAGQRAKAGQEVRLADISADAGAGHGLFEELHGFPAAGAFADYLAEQTAKNYGTAILDHLARLVMIDPGKIKEGVEALRTDFIRENVPAGADGQARRVAGRLALIAAGGELAQPVTGWPKGETIKAAAVCFAAWLNRRGGNGSQEETVALAQVRHFIESHGESRFKDLGCDDNRIINQRAGFRRQTENGLEFYILPEVFRQEVCAGLDYRTVARMLRDKGMLRTEAPDRLTMKTRNGRVYIIGGLNDEG